MQQSALICRSQLKYVIDPVYQSFGMYLPGHSSCHWYTTCQLLQNMTSGHIKVKKGTSHVFYMATPSHATEREVTSLGE